MTTERRPTVLVIDDDTIARMLAREALEQSGWLVEEAENGRLGVEAFVRHYPDLVLLDIMMPEMDGFAVCAEVRRLPTGTHTPVLMMTGLEDYQSITQLEFQLQVQHSQPRWATVLPCKQERIGI